MFWKRYEVVARPEPESEAPVIVTVIELAVMLPKLTVPVAGDVASTLKAIFPELAVDQLEVALLLSVAITRQ